MSLMGIRKKLRCYNIRATTRDYCPSTGSRYYYGYVVELHCGYAGSTPISLEDLIQTMSSWGAEYLGSYQRYPQRLVDRLGNWYNPDRNDRHMFRRLKDGCIQRDN